MNKKIVLWSIVCGLFFLSSNIVSLIIPLKMTDQGLNYSSVGTMIASFSFGLIIIKLISGYVADKIGEKKCIEVAIALMVLGTLALTVEKKMIGYVVALMLLGISRGLFTSVNTSYTFTLSENNNDGKNYGNVMGIASLLSAIGGVVATILYKNINSNVIFIGISVISVFNFLILCLLPKGGTDKKNKENIDSRFSILKMDRKLIVLAIIVAIQTMVTNPLWNMILPMYFYKKFSESVVLLGVVMSIDEFIGGPIYSVGGALCDKHGAKKICMFAFFAAAVLFWTLPIAGNALIFGVCFLLCSICITGTYVSLPVMEARFVRKEYKAMEFAIISFMASIGDFIGTYLSGVFMEKMGLHSWILLMTITYIAMVCILANVIEVEYEENCKVTD